MKFKLLVVIALVGGLYYFGIKPADVLDKGGELWGQFSDDFVALVSGEAVEKAKYSNKAATAAAIGNPGAVSVGNQSGDSEAPDGFTARMKAAADQATAINNTLDQRTKKLDEAIDKQGK